MIAKIYLKGFDIDFEIEFQIDFQNFEFYAYKFPWELSSNQ